MNQKTKYIGMLAIIPLVMVAIVPNSIGEADASNEHFIAKEKQFVESLESDHTYLPFDYERDSSYLVNSLNLEGPGTLFGFISLH